MASQGLVLAPLFQDPPLHHKPSSSHLVTANGALCSGLVMPHL
jgi:hypothetical protein